MKRSLTWLMILTLLVQLVPAASAAGQMSVTLDCTCDDPVIQVGSELHFTLEGKGTAITRLMIVPPGSVPEFRDGPEVDYVLPAEGDYAFIAYGFSSADPSAPGYAMCSDGPMYLTVKGTKTAATPTAQPTQTPAPTPTVAPGTLQLFTAMANNTFSYDMTVDVFWNTSGLFDGSEHGALHAYDQSGNYLSGVSLTQSELQAGHADVSFWFQSQPGTYRLKLSVYGGTAVKYNDDITITVEEDWAMAFVDRIATPDKDPYMWARFHRWMQHDLNGVMMEDLLGYAEDDYTDSGYLMLNYLLDEEYDYEKSGVGYTIYKATMYGLKVDLLGIAALWAKEDAEGWGEQDYADALSAAGVYYIQETLQQAQRLDNAEQAENQLAESFFELLNDSVDLSVDELKSITGWTDKLAEQYRKEFGINHGDARKALRSILADTDLTRDDLELLGFEVNPSGNVVLKFSDKAKSADKAYAALKNNDMLNSEAGKKFEAAYQEVKEVEAANNRAKKLAAGAEAVNCALSGALVIYDAVKAKDKYTAEQQKALDLLLVLAECSNEYIETLESLRSAEFLLNDNQKGGLDRYITTLKAAMNSKLQQNYARLDELAAQLADVKSSGEQAEAVYGAAEFLLDVFDAAGLAEKVFSRFGISMSGWKLSPKQSVVMLIIKAVTSVAESGVENKWHISERQDAAEQMYVTERMIEANSGLIFAHLSLYADNPSPEYARRIIAMIRHQKALKLAGEDAAWSFVNIRIPDVVQEPYEERRDMYVKKFLGRVSPLVSIWYAGDPEGTLNKVFFAYANGKKLKVSTYMDLSQYAHEYGMEAITLHSVTDTSRSIRLADQPELVQLLQECYEIVDIEADFAERLEWIDSLDIPSGP